jgi:thiol-disulfide isomerase/thioredoxin
MYNLKKVLLVKLFSLMILSSCYKENRIIEFKGNLTNLQDGTISLVKISREIIGSSNTKNGKFSIKIRKPKNFEPRLIAIEHKDKSGIKRLFHFETNRKYKNNKLFINTIFLEEGINLNGECSDVIFSNSNKNDSIRFTKITKIKGIGRQTLVMFNDSLDFKNLNDFNKKCDLITKKPFSNYYLNLISENVKNYSNEELTFLLSKFDLEVKTNKSFKDLNTYISKRNPKNRLLSLKFLNKSDIPIEIVSQFKKVNIIILWASWCGPCRMEIPGLKKIYEKNKNSSNFRMVSISLDEKKHDWAKALEIEKMQWEQLIVPNKILPFSNDIFQFDGSIPYILIANENGHILKTFKGYDSSFIGEIELLVKRNL